MGLLLVPIIIQSLRLSQDAEFVLYHDYPSVWNVSNGNLHIFPKLLYNVPEMGFSEEDIRTGHYTINQNEYDNVLFHFFSETFSFMEAFFFRFTGAQH